MLSLLDGLSYVLLFVVDDQISTQAAQFFCPLAIAGRCHNPGTCMFGKLNCHRADATGTGPDKNTLSCFQLSHIEETGPRGRSGKASCRCLLERNTIRDTSEQRCRNGYFAGIATATSGCQGRSC